MLACISAGAVAPRPSATPRLARVEKLLVSPTFQTLLEICNAKMHYAAALISKTQQKTEIHDLQRFEMLSKLQNLF